MPRSKWMDQVATEGRRKEINTGDETQLKQKIIDSGQYWILIQCLKRYTDTGEGEEE